ncbi:MAG: nicotinamide-nucleotide amidase, partial [Sulfurimonas sp.]|uniref:CinA family protein n=1 Tax=Sulfurimonas sp. TaxID=2022749 RepID=UPI0039E47D86
MKLHLLLIGNKFIYNKSLKEYVVRKVEEKCDFINTLTHFKESDNSLFLYLDEELNSSDKLVIVTTKHNFATVGKLISTITSDNQVLKDNMLIPSNATLHEKGSYLLEHKDSKTNVISMDEMMKMPEILLSSEKNRATVNIFEEDRESAIALLSPIAQMHDVTLEFITIVEGWLRIEVESKKYGNISNFINSAKQLLPKKIISAPNMLEYIIETLSANNKKISFAESCTGGLLSYYFTSHNGASKILDGSLITYSNDLKDNWLAVEHNTLEEFGAVSAQVVEQMSDGAMDVSHADYTISISGIAGDTGGTELKPVGTVYIGVRSQVSNKEFHFQLLGDRKYVQHQSALYAIKMLIIIDKDIF